MKLLNEPFTYVLGYVFMIIFTFGHAYNHYPDEEARQFANITYVVKNGEGIKGMGSAVSSIFWPLYWSVRLQEKE